MFREIMIMLHTHAVSLILAAIIGIALLYLYRFSVFGKLSIINLENQGIYFKEWYLSARSSGQKIVKGRAGLASYYILVDLQHIKHMGQIDFDNFNDRGFYYNEKRDPLSANLLTSSGPKWHFLRSKLSPLFTSGKIKGMFETLLQCGYQLQEALEDKQVIELNELSSLYTVNVIGSYAFGIDCNSFKDPNMEFKKEGENLFHINLYRAIKIYLGFFFPKLALKLGVRLFTQKSTDFFINLVKDVIEYRVKNKVTRKDMIQLLMDLKKKNKNTGMDETNCKDFNYTEIAAEVFIFFAAGFETASIALTHCLYEISLNKDIQKKLRDEIHQVLKANDGKITYDSLSDMKYMNQVLAEAFRKHPPLMFVFKKASKDYTIPGTDIELDTKSFIVYSILGIHHDPEFYPEPEKFDPERFSSENKKRIPAYAFLPFGEGPRICIGARLGVVQVKVALTLLLNTYQVSLNEKTKLPLQYKGLSLTYAPSTKIYLNIEKVAEA